MAKTKLSKSVISELKKLNIIAETEQEAREKLLKALKQHDITDVDDETLEDLMEMLSAFADDEEEEIDEEEAEVDELADEVSDEDDEDEDDSETEEESEDEDEDEDEEEEEKPAKKVKAAPAKKEASAKKEPTLKKEKAAKKEKPAGTRGTKFDGSNKEHMALLDPLFTAYPEKGYEHKIGADGVSVRLKGLDSTNRALFVFNGLKVKDNALQGVLAFNGLRIEGGADLVTSNLSEDFTERYHLEGKNLPLVKSVNVDEVITILEVICPLMEQKLSKLNDKLNKNREKLEETVKNDKAKKKEAEKKAEAKASKKSKK